MPKYKLYFNAVTDYITSTNTSNPEVIVYINPLNAELNPICHLLVLLGDLTLWVRASKYILIYVYIQQDATLHSLFISANCSTCFGWYFHPLSGTHTTVSTAFGICHTVTAICRYRGRVGTGLSVLWVAYAHSNRFQIFHDSGR
jgi:hypothetical protein